jgi:hypothetical protein
MKTYNGSFLESGFDKHMREVWGVEKFDIILGNPPFNQMIDMKFIKLSYEISDVTCIVHPSTWLLDEKGKQRAFTSAKDLIKDHLESIELFNGNGVFGISLFVPCVITYVNKSKKSKGIRCIDKINKVEITYNNIYQINKFSNVNEYLSIKSKIESKIDDNIYNNINSKGKYFVNLAQIRGNVDLDSECSMVKEDFYTLVTKDLTVTDSCRQQSFSFVTKLEAENFLKYVKTNFVRFCLSILKNNANLHRGELRLIPWMDFTQEWTDEKLYQHFNLTEDEIKFIEKHIPKYY